MNELKEIINRAYLNLKIDLSSRPEIKSINIISHINGEHLYTEYLEMLLNQSFLNRNDVDLIDVEISFSKIEDNFIVKAEFYASDGEIFLDSHYRGMIEEVEAGIEKFVSSVPSKYNDIIHKYIS